MYLVNEICAHYFLLSTLDDDMADRIFVVKQKDIFTVQEAAEYLTVSTKTVYKLIQNEELKSLKIGSRYKIAAKDLSQYVESKKK